MGCLNSSESCITNKKDALPAPLDKPRRKDRLHFAVQNCQSRLIPGLVEQEGCSIESRNAHGQTPLFVGAYCGKKAEVEMLVRLGADPNQRCRGGYTAVHAVAYAGSISMLNTLLEAGGDLRLHDCQGRTPRDWALFQMDHLKRKRMLEYIEKLRETTIKSLSAELSPASQTKSFRLKDTTPSFLNDTTQQIRKFLILRNWPYVDIFVRRTRNAQYCAGRTHTNYGFGTMFVESQIRATGLQHFPPFLESEMVDSLTLPNPDYQCGAFTKMSPKIYRGLAVTVRKLLTPDAPADLLIHEFNVYGKLKHHGLLYLMGCCQTKNLDSLHLVFEPVSLGSLHYHLHHKVGDKDLVMEVDRLLAYLCQIIDSVIFCHTCGWLHLAITSHAVQLVTPTTAKLSCLEYATPIAKASENLLHEKGALYNWMAPEILRGDVPTLASDTYSMFAVVWEVFHRTIPWGDSSDEDIKQKILCDGQKLSIESSMLPDCICTVLKKGLELTPNDRSITLSNLKEVLQNFSSYSSQAHNESTVLSPSETHTQAVKIKCIQTKTTKKEFPVYINRFSDDNRLPKEQSRKKKTWSCSSSAISKSWCKQELVTLSSSTSSGNTCYSSSSSVSRERNKTWQESVDNSAIKPASHHFTRHSSSCMLSPRYAMRRSSSEYLPTKRMGINNEGRQCTIPQSSSTTSLFKESHSEEKSLRLENNNDLPELPEDLYIDDEFDPGLKNECHMQLHLTNAEAVYYKLESEFGLGVEEATMSQETCKLKEEQHLHSNLYVTTFFKEEDIEARVRITAVE